MTLGKGALRCFAEPIRPAEDCGTCWNALVTSLNDSFVGGFELDRGGGVSPSSDFTSVMVVRGIAKSSSIVFSELIEGSSG